MMLRDQAESEKLHWLQNAWREGIDSGDAGEIDFAELKQEARRRLAASASSAARDLTKLKRTPE
jgi:hypothetical protein